MSFAGLLGRDVTGDEDSMHQHKTPQKEHSQSVQYANNNIESHIPTIRISLQSKDQCSLNKYEGEQNGQKQDDEEEELVVLLRNTVSQPGTMMVELLQANSTFIAVFHPGSLVEEADIAPS